MKPLLWIALFLAAFVVVPSGAAQTQSEFECQEPGLIVIQHEAALSFSGTTQIMDPEFCREGLDAPTLKLLAPVILLDNARFVLGNGLDAESVTTCDGEAPAGGDAGSLQIVTNLISGRATVEFGSGGRGADVAAVCPDGARVTAGRGGDAGAMSLDATEDEATIEETAGAGGGGGDIRIAASSATWDEFFGSASLPDLAAAATPEAEPLFLRAGDGGAGGAQGGNGGNAWAISASGIDGFHASAGSAQDGGSGGDIDIRGGNGGVGRERGGTGGGVNAFAGNGGNGGSCDVETGAPCVAGKGGDGGSIFGYTGDPGKGAEGPAPGRSAEARGGHGGDGGDAYGNLSIAGDGGRGGSITLVASGPGYAFPGNGGSGGCSDIAPGDGGGAGDGDVTADGGEAFGGWGGDGGFLCTEDAVMWHEGPPTLPGPSFALAMLAPLALLRRRRA